MAITVVQATTQSLSGGQNDIVGTFPAATTVGNWLVALTTTNQSEYVVPVPGTGGVATWTQAPGAFISGGGQAIYYGQVTSAGQTTVDAHESNAAYPALVCIEITGVNATTPLSSGVAPPSSGRVAGEMTGPILSVAPGQLAFSGGWQNDGSSNTTNGNPITAGWTGAGYCSTGPVGSGAWVVAAYYPATSTTTAQCFWTETGTGTPAAQGVVFNAATTVSTKTQAALTRIRTVPANTGLVFDFEDGSLGRGANVEANLGTAAISNSTALSHSGTHSLLVTASTGNTTLQMHPNYFNAVPGATYTFSAWVYSTVAIVSAFSIEISWRIGVNGAGGASGLAQPTVISSVSANTWTQVTVSGVCPVATASNLASSGAYLYLLDNALNVGQLVYIDDVTCTTPGNPQPALTRIRTIPTKTQTANCRIVVPGKQVSTTRIQTVNNLNLLTGDTASFEGGTVGRWGGYSGSTIAVSTAQAHSGTRSLLVTLTAAQATGAVIAAVTSNTLAAGLATVVEGVWVFNNNAAARSLQLRSVVNSGGYFQSAVVSCPPGVWTLLTFAPQVTAAAATGVAFQILAGGTLSSGDTYYVDDAYIVEGGYPQPAVTRIRVLAAKTQLAIANISGPNRTQSANCRIQTTAYANLLAGDSSTFEGGTTGIWGNSNQTDSVATAGSSNAVVHSGIRSMMVVASGSTGYSGTVNGNGASTFSSQVWAYNANSGARSLTMQAVWAGPGASNNTTTSPIVCPPGVWTQLLQSGSYPVGTATVQMRVNPSTGVVAGDVFYFDDAFLVVPGRSIAATVRIATAGAKTQSATCRIRVPGKQAGVVRIRTVVSQGLSGIVRLQRAVTRTQGAVTRITVFLANTQAGLVRLRSSRTTTQLGVVRLQVTPVNTQPATCRIVVSGTRPQGGTVRVLAQPSNTQAGLVRLVQARTLGQSGIARVVEGRIAQQLGVARLLVTPSVAQPGVVRLVEIRALAQGALARLVKSSTLVQGARAHIIKSSATTQPAVSRIRRVVTSIQTGITRLRLTATLAQTATTRIVEYFASTQTATARIVKAPTLPQTGLVRIRRTSTQVQPGLARVAKSRALTQAAAARVAKTPTLAQTGQLRIRVVVTSTSAARVRVVRSRSAALPALATVQVTAQNQISAAVKIVTHPVATQTGTVRIYVPIEASNPRILVTNKRVMEPDVGFGRILVTNKRVMNPL